MYQAEKFHQTLSNQKQNFKVTRVTRQIRKMIPPTFPLKLGARVLKTSYLSWNESDFLLTKRSKWFLTSPPNILGADSCVNSVTNGNLFPVMNSLIDAAFKSCVRSTCPSSNCATNQTSWCISNPKKNNKCYFTNDRWPRNVSLNKLLNHWSISPEHGMYVDDIFLI